VTDSTQVILIPEDLERGVPALLAMRAAATTALYDADNATENYALGYWGAVKDVLAEAMHIGEGISYVLGMFEEHSFKLVADSAGDEGVPTYDLEVSRGWVDGFRAAVEHAPYLEPAHPVF
jgi:hypothetical protein